MSGGSSSTRNGVRIASSKPLMRAKDMRWLFHVAATLYFVRVWVWHVSAESAGRATRQLFGGYFRYLTICCFTVQVLQLVAVTLADLTPYGIRLKLKRNADDLSCTVFVLANIVTLLFHVIEFLQPGGIINKNIGVPLPWINYSTHILNSIVAWTDIIISHPRRFSGRSFGMLCVLSVVYGCWMSVIKYETGSYPYGFLNKLPHPHGFLLMIPVVAVLLLVFFAMGKFLSSKTKHVMAPPQIEDLDVDLRTKENKQVAKEHDDINGLKLD